MPYNFWILYALAIILCCVGIKVKRWRKDITFLVMILLFLIMSSGITGTIWSDMDNYKLTYERVCNGGIDGLSDMLYFYIMKIGNGLQLSFYEFKALLISVMLLFIFLTARNYTSNIVFVFLFYMLHEMFLDGDLLRNGLAYLVVLWGIKFLFSDKKYDIMKFILCIIVVAQLHSSMYLYLLLLIIKCDRKTMTLIRKFSPLFFIILVFLLYKTNIIGIVGNIIARLISEERYSVSGYAVQLTKFGWIPILCIWSVTLVLGIYIDSCIQNSDFNYLTLPRRKFTKSGKVILKSYKIDAKKLSKNFIQIIVVSSFFVPLCILTLHFARLVKNISILFIIYMAFSYDFFSNNRHKQLIVFGGVLGITIGWLMFQVNVYSTWSLLQDTYINGNWFWRN